MLSAHGANTISIHISKYFVLSQILVRLFFQLNSAGGKKLREISLICGFDLSFS